MNARAALLLVGLPACSPASVEEPEGARRVKEELHALAREKVLSGELARTDGYVYGVDVGLLMIFAAREKDAPMYERLRGFALEHLVLDRDDDDFTRGFVVWRYCDGIPPDASGTTEALRIAEGLWRGGESFDNPEDRQWALTILDGYRRHEAEEQGVWLIRNYFNLGTRSFATNSFLVDYAPDFVAEVAERTGDPLLLELAENSYALVERAQTPTGLLYDVVQPEMATLFDDEQLVVFSPNDAVQVSNAAGVAARVVKGRPDVAGRVLDFCLERMPDLKGAYYGRTGEVARNKRPGIEAWAPLVHLAIALERHDAVGPFYMFLVSNADRTWRIPSDAWLYVTAELLLGLQAVVPGA
ncbi:MAG TPA: hypothetical protein VLK65_27990 [Vicinamibacteria bacterium]|nr:hypothetical protein [Vicinamibacteria bacterium]